MKNSLSAVLHVLAAAAACMMLAPAPVAAANCAPYNAPPFYRADGGSLCGSVASGYTCILSCATGYTFGSVVPSGQIPFLCKDDGTWALPSPLPACSPVQCPTLTAPANGAFSGVCDSRFSSSCRFTCGVGYELEGPSVVTCLADRTWSDKVPTCKDFNGCASSPCSASSSCVDYSPEQQRNTGQDHACVCNEGLLGEPSVDGDDCVSMNMYTRASGVQVQVARNQDFTVRLGGDKRGTVIGMGALKKQMDALEATTAASIADLTNRFVQTDTGRLINDVYVNSQNISRINSALSSSTKKLSDDVAAVGVRVSAVESALTRAQSSIQANSDYTARVEAAVSSTDVKHSAEESNIRASVSQLSSNTKVSLDGLAATDAAMQASANSLSNLVATLTRNVSTLSTTLSAQISTEVSTERSRAILQETSIATRVSTAFSVQDAQKLQIDGLSSSLTSLSSTVAALQGSFNAFTSSITSSLNTEISIERSRAILAESSLGKLVSDTNTALTGEISRAKSEEAKMMVKSEVLSAIRCEKDVGKYWDTVSSKCINEMPAYGFLLDLASSVAVTVIDWTAVTNWATGSKPTFVLGFTSSGGRLTAPADGIYSFHAEVRIDGANTGYFRLAIAKNGVLDANNMITSIGGSVTATYETLVCGGTYPMVRGDYVSVFIFSSGDNSYTIQSESGFSGAYLGPLNMEAFHADKAGNQVASVANTWVEVGNWRVTGGSTLFSNTNNFNLTSGRYSINTAGVYLVSFGIRIDGGDSGYFRTMMQVKRSATLDNGMTVIDGKIAPSYDTMTCTGPVYLYPGDYISVNVFTNLDTSWSIQDESSFSVTRLSSISNNVGFLADLVASIAVTATGWTKLSGFQTNIESANVGLQYSGGLFNAADGSFLAQVKGIYFIGGYVRIDGACLGFIRLIAAINSNLNVNNGLASIDGLLPCDYGYLTIEGMALLERGDQVTFHVFANSDPTYTIHSNTAISVSLIARVE